jgi:hypothetical protein
VLVTDIDDEQKIANAAWSILVATGGLLDRGHRRALRPDPRGGCISSRVTGTSRAPVKGEGRPPKGASGTSA